MKYHMGNILRQAVNGGEKEKKSITKISESISQYIGIANHHVVHLKLTQY